MKTDCFAYQKNLQEKKAQKEYLKKLERDRNWKVAENKKFSGVRWGAK